MVLLVVGVPALLRLTPSEHGSFHEDRLSLLKRQKPELLLLGDSMLGSRIDENVLNRVSGRNSCVFAQPGSSSAIWYLILKNFASQPAPPPRVAIIFFRARQLTIPGHRTKGIYRQSMERYMRSDEPVLHKVLGLDQRATCRSTKPVARP